MLEIKDKIFSLIESFDPVERFCQEFNLKKSIDPREFLLFNGFERTCFKSRDNNDLYLGLGRLKIQKSDLAKLSEEQMVFYGRRFALKMKTGQEWEKFGNEILLLPIFFFKGEKVFFNWINNGLNNWAIFKDVIYSVFSRIEQKNIVDKYDIEIETLGRNIHEDQYSYLINKAKDFIGRDKNKKIVLARRSEFLLKDKIDPFFLFLSILNNQVNCFKFFVDINNQAFFGASPEMLFMRNGKALHTEAVAGTKPANVKDEDILQDHKEINEHLIVKKYIENTIKSISNENTLSSLLVIKEFFNLKHIYQSFMINLDNNICDFSIIDLLHPTPATLGMDPERALEFILQNENFDRGFYAGPFGIISQKYSQIVVGIRSGFYYDQRLFLYVGSGIVSDSDAKKEWAELDLKECYIKKMIGILDDD